MGAEELPKKMKAIQVVEYHKPYQINEIDVPSPSDLRDDDLLVKIAVASNCHTDQMVQEGIMGTKLPCTGSHEGAGTVVAVGKNAGSRGFKEGTRVMCGIPYHPCMECGDCKGPEGSKQYCMKLEGHKGVHINGYFSDYAICDSRTSTPMPDEVTFRSAAPLACAGRTVWRAVLQAGEAAEEMGGKWITIVGSGGGLGHLGVQFAKALGYKVIGVDARDEGLKLTKDYGADVAVDARKGKDSVVEEVHKVTDGEGSHSTIVLSDHKDATAIGCASSRMHATLVQVAQPDEIIIPFPEVIFRDIRIHGSLICSPEQSKSMMKTIAEHGIKVTTVPFEGLEKINELTELVHSGKLAGKAIIVVDPKQVEEEKKMGAKY